MSANQKSTLVEPRVPKRRDLPAPTAANWFSFSWSGGVEVQMLVGYVDAAPRPDEDKPGEKLRIDVAVSDRIFMSVRGFAILKANVDEATARLKADGVPIDSIIADSIVHRPSNK